ncbi:MAG: hypothetical protein ACRC1K_13000, partial [Planctomycetia bacterium]
AAIIRKATAKNPSHRYQDAAELWTMLQALLDEASESPSDRWVVNLRAAARKKTLGRYGVLGASGVAGVCVGQLAFWLMAGSSSRSPSLVDLDRKTEKKAAVVVAAAAPTAPVAATPTQTPTPAAPETASTKPAEPSATDEFKKIDPADALQNEGVKCLVEYRVESIGKANSGVFWYLNSQADFRSELNFTAAIDQNGQEELKARSIEDFDAFKAKYLNAKVQVNGVVGTHQGKPQIIVKTGSQVSDPQ